MKNLGFNELPELINDVLDLVKAQINTPITDDDVLRVLCVFESVKDKSPRPIYLHSLFIGADKDFSGTISCFTCVDLARLLLPDTLIDDELLDEVKYSAIA